MVKFPLQGCETCELLLCNVEFASVERVEGDCNVFYTAKANQHQTGQVVSDHTHLRANHPMNY